MANNRDASPRYDRNTVQQRRSEDSSRYAYGRSYDDGHEEGYRAGLLAARRDPSIDEDVGSEGPKHQYLPRRRRPLSSYPRKILDLWDSAGFDLTIVFKSIEGTRVQYANREAVCAASNLIAEKCEVTTSTGPMIEIQLSDDDIDEVSLVLFLKYAHGEPLPIWHRTNVELIECLQLAFQLQATQWTRQLVQYLPDIIESGRAPPVDSQSFRDMLDKTVNLYAPDARPWDRWARANMMFAFARFGRGEDILADDHCLERLMDYNRLPLADLSYMMAFGSLHNEYSSTTGESRPYPDMYTLPSSALSKYATPSEGTPGVWSCPSVSPRSVTMPHPGSLASRDAETRVQDVVTGRQRADGKIRRPLASSTAAVSTKGHPLPEPRHWPAGYIMPQPLDESMGDLRP